MPDSAWKANNDLRAVSEKLLFISRKLHELTSKLEGAVEGTYVTENGDPRIRLLTESLLVSRDADQDLGRLTQILQRVVRTVSGDGDSSSAPSFERERAALSSSIIDLQRKSNELETLYGIARALNSTLDFDKVLQMVMDQVISVVNAERGFLVLLDTETNQLEFKIARDKHVRTIDSSAFAFEISHSTVERVMSTGQPVLTDDAQVDVALKAQQSIMAYGIRSIMCAPLVVRDKCIGAVYVDSRINTNLFSDKLRDLLLAFCHQAAIAIDNARLFADLTKTIRQVNEDKQYMDNIFASIANGVVTTDSSGLITTFNDAAGLILRLNPADAVGKHYTQVFKVRSEVGLIELLQHAWSQHEHDTIVPRSVDCYIEGRDTVNLNLYVSSLHDSQNAHIGIALVIDDRTEMKRATEQVKLIRRIFGQYVHPNVVQQLIEDPRALHLGGETKEITVIFADIRGYTRLSESMAPEKVMNLLNSYLEIMGKEIWDEEGTLTSFMGDALMAIFNAPLPQEDHVLRAVRAAWKMRMAVLEYQRRRPQEIPISFGFGVNTGLATVGNIGSQGRMQNYTAIGDVVNVASRLQTNASDNNILLNHATFVRVRQHVRVAQLPPLQVKNKSAPLDVWCMIGLV